MPDVLLRQRLLAAVDPQFGNLAGDGVTADTQRLCRFDAVGHHARPVALPGGGGVGQADGQVQVGDALRGGAQRRGVERVQPQVRVTRRRRKAKRSTPPKAVR